VKKKILCLILLIPLAASAGSAGVLKVTTERSLDEVYGKIYDALETEQFWVVFEADMGERMARFAESWGEDYNRSGLGTVKSMVFCNIWWTNRIANADPDLLAMCPLHLSLYEKDGETHVVMPALSHMAEGSEGRERAAQLETELAGIIDRALASD